MGNICSTSGSHHVYSPPASPLDRSGASTPVYRAAGQALTSVHQLSDEARDDFLSHHDPMLRLGLGPDTPLYRTTHKRYLRGGELPGHPGSCARIALHEELTANPYAAHSGYTADDALAYRPRRIRASDLKDPSLNVMAGSDARNSVRGYAKEDHVTVQMRLGDFLDRGGKVYTDVSSFADRGEAASALIVTLPKGRKVPVQIIE